MVVRLKGGFVEAPRGALRQRVPAPREGEPRGGTFEMVPDGEPGGRAMFRSRVPASSGGTVERAPDEAPGGGVMLPSRTLRDGGTEPSAARVAEIRAALQRHHPAALGGGVPATRPIWFVVDARGRIVKTGQAPDEPFTGAVPADEVADVEVIKGAALGLGEGGGVIWFRLKP
jgi:hypothetical protein